MRIGVEFENQLQWGRGSLGAAWLFIADEAAEYKELQWGRGVTSSDHAWLGSSMLQWGRGSLAAAWRGLVSVRLSGLGFNGAAAH